MPPPPLELCYLGPITAISIMKLLLASNTHGFAQGTSLLSLSLALIMPTVCKFGGTEQIGELLYY